MVDVKLTEDAWPADPGVEGLLANWLVSEGDFVKEGDIILEAIFVKTNVEIPSPATGVIKEISAQKNERFKAGMVLAKIDETVAVAEEPIEAPPEEKERIVQKVDAAMEPEKERILATPAAKAVAKDIGIDPSQVKGTGPRGKVTEQDVRRFAESVALEEASKGLTVLERNPVAGIRKTIAQRMTASWRGSPQVTEIVKVDMEPLVQFREELQEKWIEKHNVNVTYEDFIVQALALSLADNREFNSALVDDEILIYAEINIGFAVDTPEGLIVPVIKNTNTKSVFEVAQERRDLVEKALTGALSDADVSDGTCTITNLGTVGIESFTPILNPPQTVILGVGRIAKKPVVINNTIEARHMANLCLVFDHRVVDGYPAAEFLNEIKLKLEKPRDLI